MIRKHTRTVVLALALVALALSALFFVPADGGSCPSCPADTPIADTFSADTLSPGPVPTAYGPGELVPDDVILSHGAAVFFRNVALPDTVFALMQGRSYKSGCPVPREELRYLLCLHRDLGGRAVVGEMVVHVRVADAVLDIFRQLYEASYPIERMRLVDYWDADDERSMSANNSSAFNFRMVSHTTVVSKHGLGLAIDINPLYNPYHRVLPDSTCLIEPQAGAPYLDRTRSFPYKIAKGDLCYRLFLSKGFQWGGDWGHCKDYQHFELDE